MKVSCRDGDCLVKTIHPIWLPAGQNSKDWKSQENAREIISRWRLCWQSCPESNTQRWFQRPGNYIIEQCTPLSPSIYDLVIMRVDHSWISGSLTLIKQSCFNVGHGLGLFWFTSLLFDFWQGQVCALWFAAFTLLAETVDFFHLCMEMYFGIWL